MWYFDLEGKKWPATVLACHPSGEEAMVQVRAHCVWSG